MKDNHRDEVAEEAMSKEVEVTINEVEDVVVEAAASVVVSSKTIREMKIPLANSRLVTFSSSIPRMIEVARRSAMQTLDADKESSRSQRKKKVPANLKRRLKQKNQKKMRNLND